MTHQTCGKQRGFTLVEVAAAIFLLTAALAAFAQLRSTIMTQRHRLDTADAARRELQNIWETLGDVSVEALESGGYSKETLDARVARTLPEGTLEIDVVPLVFHAQEGGDEVTVHRARATVTWSDGKNAPKRTLSLSRLLP